LTSKKALLDLLAEHWYLLIFEAALLMQSPFYDVQIKTLTRMVLLKNVD
jgi:hypothetical protein